jgi:hypothetical protein
VSFPPVAPSALFAGLCTLDLIRALDEGVFTAALRFAAEVAARSCLTFGTRAWMN